jgi:FkbM family methyltransferase
MSVFANHATDIIFDTRTGAIKNAALHERLALWALRIATTLLEPLHLFGITYIARAVRKVLPSKKSIKLILNDDSIMRIDYCDAYWTPLLKPKFEYEGAVLKFIKTFKSTPYAFIDGGANHGYWSVLASSKSFGAHKAVAIEAASDTFEHLNQNRELNAGRFVVMNRAIGATTGEHVRVYGAKHEARTIVPSQGAKPILDCQSISLDDLADHLHFGGNDNLIVKLDVEGMEVIAMNAAKRLMAKDSVFLYEDHGSDASHEATSNAISNLGMRVFWFGDKTPVEIVDAQELTAIKKSKRFGYDLAATKSAFWLKHLDELLDNKQAVPA